MNLSKIINRIKKADGIGSLDLPIFGVSKDEYIKDILLNQTLVDFSICAPTIRDFYIDLTRLERIDPNNDDLNINAMFSSRSETFVLPQSLFGDDDLLFVVGVNDSTMYGVGATGSVGPVRMLNNVNNNYGCDLTEQVISANAMLNQANQLIPKITFHFREPYYLTLFNRLKSNYIRLTVALGNSENFNTISLTKMPAFLKLARLDVKKNIYNNCIQYNEINSPTAKISIKLIETFSNADSERDQLYQEYLDNAHIDNAPLIDFG
jgi:hypothetical protein